MNELLDRFLAALKGTSGGTRVIALLSGAALLAIVGVAALVSSRPHYELAFSGLTDHELALVCKALSEAAIPFQQSQPPGPFVVYVDEAQRSAAYMAAYGAGALDKPLEGILADGGMASVFNSAEERSQGVRKREWQEMEKMLEELDFVAGARVRTSPGSPLPLAGARPFAPTASVTLRVVGSADLTHAQSETVANLVSRGMGVAKTDLTISDQTGKSLYDGAQHADEGHETQDLLAHQAEYERRLAGEANEVLASILGPNKARVSVNTEWDYAQSTLHKETSEKGVVVQETKTSSEKPQSSAGASSVAGVSSNTLDPTNPTAAPAGAAPSEALVDKTSEEKRTYAPSVSREDRVRFVPELKRLSVALFLDQSVKDPQKLEAAVKAAVGFDEERKDSFSAIVLSFATPPEPEKPAGAAAPAPAPAEPSPLLETLLRRGVEIASALVFLVLLLKSLKGSKKAAAAAQVADDGIDPELLARAQVDELLKSDPAKVGEILSRWAREGAVATSGAPK